MLTRTKKRIIGVAIIFTCLLTLLGMLTGEAALANQHPPGHHGPEKAVRRLPPGSRTLWVGGSRYFHHGGVFYKEGPSGFLIINAPIGAIVLSIPVGSRAVLVGGITYYLCDGTYYRRVGNRYLVVEPPLETVAVREISPVIPSEENVGEEVSVTVPLLNVRSGPGMDFPVIHQAHKNDILTIHGYAPEWLYVNLPQGGFGWVMLRYTTPHPRPAEG